MIVDSDWSGAVAMDEQLITSSTNCSNYNTVLLEFSHYYNYYASDTAQVDVSADGGTTWTNVLGCGTADTVVWNIVDITNQAAEQSDVKVRWHYTANDDWYWAIDNVRILGKDTNNSYPSTPAVTSPTANEVDVSLAPTLTGSAFADGDGDSHQATHWQVAQDTYFSSPIFDSGDYSPSTLTSMTLLSGVLEAGNNYYVRVRYRDLYGWSNWSVQHKFDTLVQAATDDADGNGVPDAQETATTDVNLDGTDDAGQNWVLGLVNGKTNEDVGISSEGNVVESVEYMSENAMGDSPPTWCDFPYGIFSCRISGVEKGNTCLITFTLPSALIGPLCNWYKYDDTNGWQNYTSHITTYNGRHVTIEVQDGGYGDADGIANGVIIDPGGPVWTGGGAAATADEDDDGNGGSASLIPGTCFIATACYGTPLAEEVITLCQFRDQYLLTNRPGRLFVKTYYELSPPLAEFITRHPGLKK